MSQGPQVDETEGQELDLAVSGLQQPVYITMPLSANSMGTTHVCSYFDERGKSDLVELVFSGGAKRALNE